MTTFLFLDGLSHFCLTADTLQWTNCDQLNWPVFCIAGIQFPIFHLLLGLNATLETAIYYPPYYSSTHLN